MCYIFSWQKNLFRNKNSWVQKLSGFPFNFLFHSFSSFLSFQFWRIQRTKKSRTFFQGHFSIKFLAYSPSLEYLASKAYIIWLHVNVFCTFHLMFAQLKSYVWWGYHIFFKTRCAQKYIKMSLCNFLICSFHNFSIFIFLLQSYSCSIF